LKEVDEGKIRIIARGSDIASLDRQTVRVRDRQCGFAQETARMWCSASPKPIGKRSDWMYSDPDAIKRYAQKVGQPGRFRAAIDPENLSEIDVTDRRDEGHGGHPA